MKHDTVRATSFAMPLTNPVRSWCGRPGRLTDPPDRSWISWGKNYSALHENEGER
jgi:acetoacetate decarboxylase